MGDEEIQEALKQIREALKRCRDAGATNIMEEIILSLYILSKEE
jgi:hypothetical protein